MLAASAMFAVCFESCYPANYSPFKIFLGKNKENLQVPAGVVLSLELMRALDQVHRNAIIMCATLIENSSLPQGGHGLTNTQIRNRLKRAFKISPTVQNNSEGGEGDCTC